MKEGIHLNLFFFRSIHKFIVLVKPHYDFPSPIVFFLPMRILEPLKPFAQPYFCSYQAYNSLNSYQMNNKSKTSINKLQETLQHFYSTVVTGHRQSEQKIQILELFLKKINEYQINKIVKPQKEQKNIQTQASLQDAQQYAANKEIHNKMNPNMLYTFLFSNSQNRDFVESSHLIKIKPKVQLQSKSLKRVLLMAIFVYYIHFRQSRQQNTMAYESSKHLLRVIKKAQVKSAYLVRELFGRTLYSKTRFLCQKLYENVEDASLSKEQIIKIIIQEFHPFYIDQIFTLLSHQVYSQSCITSLNSLDFTSKFNNSSLEKRKDPSNQQLRASLDKLNICLTVYNEQKIEEIGKSSNINVVVEQKTKGLYSLSEITKILK